MVSLRRHFFKSSSEHVSHHEWYVSTQDRQCCSTATIISIRLHHLLDILTIVCSRNRLALCSKQQTRNVELSQPLGHYHETWMIDTRMVRLLTLCTVKELQLVLQLIDHSCSPLAVSRRS